MNPRSRWLLPLCLCLVTSAPRALAQETDEDEGMGSTSLLVSAYDPKTRTGSLVAVLGEDSTEAVVERPGEVAMRLYEATSDDGMPLVFALWKRLDAPGEWSPELWTLPGFPSLVWGGLPRVRWVDAEVVVRPGKDGLEAWVSRSLSGENQETPALRVKEQLFLGPTGMTRGKRSVEDIKTPAQRLNWIAELGAEKDIAEMVDQVRKLPRKPAQFIQRAAILLTRFGDGTRLAEQAHKILELLATESSSPEVVTAAADRILEMAWEQARKEPRE